MDPDESVTWVIDPEDYKADVLFVFENGRVARVALAGYVTKTNRKRLKNAIYGGSKLLFATVLKEDRDLALVSSDQRLINFNTSLLKTKTTNSTQGVLAFTAKNGRIVTMVGTAEEFLGGTASVEKFRAASLPSSGFAHEGNGHEEPVRFGRVIAGEAGRTRGALGVLSVLDAPGRRWARCAANAKGMPSALDALGIGCAVRARREGCVRPGRWAESGLEGHGIAGLRDTIVRQADRLVHVRDELLWRVVCRWLARGAGGGGIAAAESGGLLERYRVAAIPELAPHPEEPRVRRAHPCTVRAAGF